MSHPFLLLIFLLSSCSVSYAQKYWDGGGGTNLWNDPWNWTSNTVPAPHEDVILDNSIVTASYTVMLPNSVVSIRSVSIRPSLNRNIELTLPPSNTQIPGFIASGPGYGMVLHAGAIFRNSSGSGSGGAVSIRDSIRINNDGRYIHNTTGGHVNSVQILSTTAGTESGIFEIDIPSASSTLSLSGRVFGRLILRSGAAGGSCNYTAAGTNRVVIKNDLEIGAGVNLSLNCSDTIFVGGDFIQDGGTFNLGTTTRSVVFHVSQNLVQAAGAVITESGTGTHNIVMGGSGLQLLAIRGTWANQVALVKDGTSMVLLKTLLSLPYSLHLKSGKIVTTAQWPLVLQPSCTIIADTLTALSCVTGPLRKEGLLNGSFLFPVGDETRMRWVRLEQATGTFTVQYFGDNPRLITGSLGTGLHHISAVEYWTIDAATTNSSTLVKLSFFDPHSGGVTDMRTLRVARLINTSWQNAGNTSFAGTAGSNGWVNSNSVTNFSSTSRTFALASSNQFNPLPLFDPEFSVDVSNKKYSFRWNCIDISGEPEVFELQHSQNGMDYETFRIVFSEEEKKNYAIEVSPKHEAPYYRLRMKVKNSDFWYESRPVRFFRKPVNEASFLVTATGTQLRLHASIPHDELYHFVLYNLYGQTVAAFSMHLYQGYNNFLLPIGGVPPGIYVLKITNRKLNSYTTKFRVPVG